MTDYTLIVDNKQRELIVKALEKYSQLWLGQTGEEMDNAKKLYAVVSKEKNTTVNLAALLKK